jgi:hypothetical protein
MAKIASLASFGFEKAEDEGSSNWLVNGSM